MKDEYLLTNYLGSYCSSTFHTGNSRKYHGLLVASNDNLERFVVVNRVEEEIVTTNKSVKISSNRYLNNVIYPEGYRYLRKHCVGDNVELNYEISGSTIKKKIYLNKKQNFVEVNYELNTLEESTLIITPLLTYRSIHKLLNRNNYPDFKIINNSNSVIIRYSDESYLIITGNFFKFNENIDFYNDFYYAEEEKRGYEFSEDLLSIGNFEYSLDSGVSELQIKFEFVFSNNNPTFEEFKSNSSSGLKNIKSNKLKSFYEFLSKRSDDFLVSTTKKKTIIAGYPWFDDWGRDTFISFRGLLLVKNHFSLAKEILLSWTKNIDNGLVANRPGKNEFNSIDGSLWYLHSIFSYWEFTQDNEFIKRILPHFASIIQDLITGTSYGIKVNTNGILYSTDPNKALTWMDAVVDGKPVTPRNGAAVEIQFLWYNALKIYSLFDKEFNFGMGSSLIKLYIKNLKDYFNHIFWIPEYNYLADYLSDNKINIQIRPNQIIGLSLPFNLLSKEKSVDVTNKVKNKLVKSVGLYTLDPIHPNFIDSYSGDQITRDLAYHNGTIWPWLLGIYLKGYINTFGKTESSVTYIESMLEQFWDSINKMGLNYIPEVFSAKSKVPEGCLSQAWNYATFLEVFYDLYSK